MNRLAHSKTALATIALIACAFGGCSTFNAFEQRPDLGLRQNRSVRHVNIVRGKPRPVIDGLGKVFGIPNRIALGCLLYTSPSPRDATLSRMPSSA